MDNAIKYNREGGSVTVRIKEEADKVSISVGLSIVKHGAQLHNAALKLDSEPGKGTTVTITF